MATMTRFRCRVAIRFAILFVCAVFVGCASNNISPVRPPESYKGPLAEQPVLQQGDFWVYAAGSGTRTKSIRLFSNIGFPLWIGKTWSYEAEARRAGLPSAATSSPLRTQVTCHVGAFHQVSVTAGTFEAFQCECQCELLTGGGHYQEGCGLWTYWYAPAVKNIVRTKTASTATSIELVEYRTSLPKATSGNTQPRESSVAELRDLLVDKYRMAKSGLLKNDDGSRDFAVSLLEDIVAQNPAFENASTLLGKGYYQMARYNDAMQILKRALAVNNTDEIAWIVFGLTQMRLRDDQEGLASLKGGITLLGKASQSGYRGFPNWDSRSLVRAALRRTAFMIVGLDKGSSKKEDIINSTEFLLRVVDGEELAQGETPGNTVSKQNRAR